MYISSAGSHRGLLIAIRGIDMKFSQRNKQKTVEVGREVGRFNKPQLKHHTILIANVGILLLDRKHKLHWKWGHIVSYVAHQYSRVDFYSSLEVNLSLYYGGVASNWLGWGALFNAMGGNGLWGA